MIFILITLIYIFFIGHSGEISDKGPYIMALNQIDDLKIKIREYSKLHKGKYPTTLDDMVNSSFPEVPKNYWGKKLTIDNYLIISEISPSNYMKIPYRTSEWIFYNDGKEIKRTALVISTRKLMDRTIGKDPTVCKEKNYIAYAENGIMYYNLGDSTIHITKVTTSSNHIQPCWSPEGNRIVYADTNDNNIYVVKINKPKENLLNISAKVSDKLSNPSFSSNGRKVVTQSSANELWILDVNNAEPPKKLVTSANGGGKDPSWSNKGNIIIFKDNEGKLTRIKATDYMEKSNSRNSQELEILTDNGAPLEGENPHWSPDDLSIVYTHNGKLLVYSFLTKQITELKDNHESISGTNPVWGYR